MKFKKIATTLCGVVLATALSACGGTAETPSSDGTTADNGGGDKPRVALIAKSIAGEFWVTSREGAEKAGEDLGVEVSFNGTDTESEGEKQLNQLEAAINGKPIGIGFAAQNGAEEGAPRLLEQATKDGVNIVAFATPMSFSDSPIATVASNNVLMGEMAAENMIRVLDGKGKVAIITNGEVGDAAIRRDSFRDFIAANAPDIEIVDVQNGEADRAKSMDKAQAILQANQDLAGFYCTGDHGTIAAADQVKAMGKDTKVIGIDANPEVASMIQAGEVTGVVTQDAFQVGYQTVKVLVDAANGTMPAEKEVVVPSVWADQDNITEPDVAKVMGLS